MGSPEISTKKYEKDTTRMCWEILAHKFLYYKCHTSIITDHEYDILEKEWEQRTGRIAPVGFPDTPSARLVANMGQRTAEDFIKKTLKMKGNEV